MKKYLQQTEEIKFIHLIYIIQQEIEIDIKVLQKTEKIN